MTTPLIRDALRATATVNFFTFVLQAMFVVYATRVLHVGPGPLGLVLGAGALGAVAGSAGCGRIESRLGLGPTFILGSALFPAPLLLIPAATGPHLAVLTMLFGSEFGSGFGVMILDITIAAIFAGTIPDAMRPGSPGPTGPSTTGCGHWAR